MKIVLLALIIFLCSCAPITAQAQNAPAIAMQATAQATETRPPEPTVDILPTLQALQQNEQAAIMARLQAESTAVHAQETAVAAGVVVAQITQSSEWMRATVTVEAIAANATREAGIHAAQATADQSAINNRLAEATRLAAEAEYIRAGTEQQTATGKIVGWIFVGIASLIGACALLWLAYQNQQEPEAEQMIDENLADVPVQPSAPVRGWERSDGVVNRDTEPPGDPEKFRALIKHAEVNPLGRNNVVIAKIYSTYGEYDPVLRWLEKHEYIKAGPSGEKMLNDAGDIFCANWQVLHPCSSVSDVQNDTLQRL